MPLAFRRACRTAGISVPGGKPYPCVKLVPSIRISTGAAGPVNILSGVSLSVESGEAAALIGPSGSGKSSLLMVAAGLEAPSAGRAMIAGTEITNLDEDALARFRRGNIGIVFQSFHLI